MLLDHFGGDLARQRDWHGFHQAWAITLASDLNQRLPDGWFAEPNVQFQIEIDVGAFDVRDGVQSSLAAPDRDAATLSWTAPEPTLVLEVPSWSDVVAVEIYAPGRPRNLAGAIELVSPSNKDRPESREQFVAKCERYLHLGLGLLIVDVVTSRRANLQQALLERFAPDHEAPVTPLFACSYQPRTIGDRLRLEMWLSPLAVGQPLPTLPLYLRDGPLLAVNLQQTYLDACRRLRIANPANV